MYEVFTKLLNMSLMASILVLIIIVLRFALKKAPKNYQSLICYGVFFYLFSHIVINLGGVLGLMPLTGIPLPFISYLFVTTLHIAVALESINDDEN